MTNGFLRDPQGRAVIMRGANVAGSAKLPPYFGFQQAADYQRMRTDWGMNGLRFIMSWSAIEPTEGNYNSDYLDGVAERIQWAKDAGILVVLDMHDDVYGEGFMSGGGDGAPTWTCDSSNYASFTPASDWVFNDLSAQVTACYDHFWQSADLQSHYAEAWKRVVTRLAAFDNVIGFDVMNEPYWGSAAILYFEPTILQPFYESIVPQVRSVSPNLVAFLEPSTFRNIGGVTHLSPFPFADVVYSPHSYDTNAEQGQGFDPTHRYPIISNVLALANEAKGLNAALWVGEYGGVATESGISEYMNAQYDGIGAVAGSSMIWSYDESDGYGLLAPDGSERTTLLNAVVKPFPELVAGDPISYGFDRTTNTFTFRYTSDASITAPTVISVPARVYPSGFTVSCGGCQNTTTNGEVTLTSVPPGNPAVVTITGAAH